MTTIALAAPSRLDQVARVLDGLARVTAEELEAALPNLEQFIKVVEVLIDRDDTWQRRLRREIVVALSKIPVEASKKVTTRFSLRLLHSCIVEHGPRPALDALAKEPCPAFIDLVRVYRPGYGMPSEESAEARERERIDRMHRAPWRARQSYLTVGVVRRQVFAFKEMVRRLEVVLQECDERGIRSTGSEVPTDILRRLRTQPKLDFAGWSS